MTIIHLSCDSSGNSDVEHRRENEHKLFNRAVAARKALESTVARKDLKGFSGEGWHPEQAVSREQALQMFTIWPAYAAFVENSRGTIEPGKFADFTVLSRDIMHIPEAEILNTTCAMTVINGEVEYDGGQTTPRGSETQ